MSVIGKNIFWLVISQVLTWMVSLTILIVAPDRLGAANWGKFQFAFAYVSFFTFVGSLGTGTLIVKTIARSPDLLGSYVFNTLIMKIAVAILLSLLAVGLGSLLGYNSQAMGLIAIGLIGMALVLISEPFLAALTGIEQMARPAVWSVVQMYAAAIGALVVLATHHGILAYAACFAFAPIIPLVANGRSVWPRLKGKKHFDYMLCVRIIRGGLPLLALSGLVLIYGSIDIPLLEKMTNSATVGRYSLAYTWVGIPVFISTIVVTAFLPSLSALATKSNEEFATLANRALRLIFVVAIPASTGTIVVAHDIIGLIYNNEYQGSALLMQILAIHIPLAAMSTVLAATLVASDRQNKLLLVAGIAAVLNPPVTILAIHLTVRSSHNGAIGAAIATVLTEVFIVGGALRIRRPGVMDRSTSWYAARCLLASLSFVPVLVILHRLNLFAEVAIAALIYACAALALRTVSISQLLRAKGQLRGGTPSVPEPTEFGEGPPQDSP